MSTGDYDAALRLGRPDASIPPGQVLRRWWGRIASLLMAAVFVEAVFAGAMLSGVGWARQAHAMGAVVLVASAIVAGVTGVVSLRRVPHGLKLGLMLLGLAGTVLLQAAVGALSAKGANLLWVHVPLGVALLGLAGQTVANARRLGGD